jgi:hypothetical protein
VLSLGGWVGDALGLPQLVGCRRCLVELLGAVHLGGVVFCGGGGKFVEGRRDRVHLRT